MSGRSRAPPIGVQMAGLSDYIVNPDKMVAAATVEPGVSAKTANAALDGTTAPAAATPYLGASSAAGLGETPVGPASIVPDVPGPAPASVAPSGPTLEPAADVLAPVSGNTSALNLGTSVPSAGAVLETAGPVLGLAGGAVSLARGNDVGGAFQIASSLQSLAPRFASWLGQGTATVATGGVEAGATGAGAVAGVEAGAEAGTAALTGLAGTAAAAAPAALVAIGTIAASFLGNDQRQALRRAIHNAQADQGTYRTIVTDLQGIRTPDDFVRVMRTHLTREDASIGTILRSFAESNLRGDYAQYGWDPNPKLSALVGMLDLMGIPVMAPNAINRSGGPAPDPYNPNIPAFQQLYGNTAIPFGVQHTTLNTRNANETWGPILDSLATGALHIDPSLANRGPQAISQQDLNRRIAHTTMMDPSQGDDRDFVNRLGQHLTDTYQQGGEPEQIRQRLLDYYQAVTGQAWQPPGGPGTGGDPYGGGAAPTLEQAVAQARAMPDLTSHLPAYGNDQGKATDVAVAGPGAFTGTPYGNDQGQPTDVGGVTPQSYNQSGWTFHAPSGLFQAPRGGVYRWSGTEMTPVSETIPAVTPQNYEQSRWSFAPNGLFRSPEGSTYRWSGDRMVPAPSGGAGPVANTTGDSFLVQPERGPALRGGFVPTLDSQPTAGRETVQAPPGRAPAPIPATVPEAVNAATASVREALAAQGLVGTPPPSPDVQTDPATTPMSATTTSPTVTPQNYDQSGWRFDPNGLFRAPDGSAYRWSGTAMVPAGGVEAVTPQNAGPAGWRFEPNGLFHAPDGATYRWSGTRMMPVDWKDDVGARYATGHGDMGQAINQWLQLGVSPAEISQRLGSWATQRARSGRGG